MVVSLYEVRSANKSAEVIAKINEEMEKGTVPLKLREAPQEGNYVMAYQTLPTVPLVLMGMYAEQGKAKGSEKVSLQLMGLEAEVLSFKAKLVEATGLELI